jgi:hypothetical protein
MKAQQSPALEAYYTLPISFLNTCNKDMRLLSLGVKLPISYHGQSAQTLALGIERAITGLPGSVSVIFASKDNIKLELLDMERVHSGELHVYCIIYPKIAALGYQYATIHRYITQIANEYIPALLLCNLRIPINFLEEFIKQIITSAQEAQHCAELLSYLKTCTADARDVSEFDAQVQSVIDNLKPHNTHASRYLDSISSIYHAIQHSQIRHSGRSPTFADAEEIRRRQSKRAPLSSAMIV